MAEEMTLLNRMLQVEAPWTVRDYSFSESGRRLDVSLGIETPRSWFGRIKKTPLEETEKVWRHVNFDQSQCYIHVFVPKGASLAKQNWAGEEDSVFTRAMARQVFALLREGAGYEGICSLLGVAFNDIWKFKYALDSGQANQPQPEPTPRPSASIAAPVIPADASTPVPDVDSPVWQQLVESRLDLDIRVLSLKLLLTRIRSQLDLVQDEEMKHLKMRELHRYFLKNQRMLGHELEQLGRA